MSTNQEGPQLYTVSYSYRTRAKILDLATAARQRGDGAAFLAALREFDRRLHIYPQFGDPLKDLQVESGQLRLGVVPPLSMRYGVLEERRIVFVTALPVLLSKRHTGTQT